MITSDLSITTVGRRKLRRSNTQDEKMKDTTVLVLKDLVEDSQFFYQNSARTMPVFDPKDLTVGEELGRGEFGIVLEVSDISVTSTTTTASRSESYAAGFPPSSSNLEASPFSPPPSIVILSDDDLDRLKFEESKSNPPTHQRTESVVTFAEQTNEEDHSSSDENDDDEDEPSGQEEEKHFAPSPALSNKKFPTHESNSPNYDMRIRLAQRVLRDGKPRYALKRLKSDVGVLPKVDAALDLACEARFLQCISHTNIIRLRGTVGEPGTASFGILLDKLTHTLDLQIDIWKKAYKKSHTPLQVLFHRKKHKEDEHMLYAERVVVALDIARALRHLHRKRVLYRDLKPDNIGFNVRGDIQIFDFGLAKELKVKELVEGEDGYEATGLTGSRRFMAPEVVRCLPYGFSADVFSFAILFWQIFALETPFPNLDANKHFEQVVQGQKRPHKLTHVLPAQLHNMMETAWSDNPKLRPTFKQMCMQLQAEFALVNGGADEAVAVMDRSFFLSDRSINSTGGVNEED